MRTIKNEIYLAYLKENVKKDPENKKKIMNEMIDVQNTLESILNLIPLVKISSNLNSENNGKLSNGVVGLYHSEGEGGIAVKYGIERRNILGPETLYDCAITFIGATGSLKHKVEKAFTSSKNFKIYSITQNKFLKNF